MAFAEVGAEFPRVASELARLSGEDLGRAVARVVEAALASTSLTVADRDKKAVERLVWSLDDSVWDLQDKAEKGEVPQVAYLRAFLQARAGNSLLELLDGRFGPAVYEAIQALNGNEGRVLEILAQPGG